MDHRLLFIYKNQRMKINVDSVQPEQADLFSKDYNTARIEIKQLRQMEDSLLITNSCITESRVTNISNISQNSQQRVEFDQVKFQQDKKQKKTQSSFMKFKNMINMAKIIELDNSLEDQNSQVTDIQNKQKSVDQLLNKSIFKVSRYNQVIEKKYQFRSNISDDEISSQSIIKKTVGYQQTQFISFTSSSHSQTEQLYIPKHQKQAEKTNVFSITKQKKNVEEISIQTDYSYIRSKKHALQKKKQRKQKTTNKQKQNQNQKSVVNNYFILSNEDNLTTCLKQLKLFQKKSDYDSEIVNTIINNRLNVLLEPYLLEPQMNKSKFQQ